MNLQGLGERIAHVDRINQLRGPSAAEDCAGAHYV